MALSTKTRSVLAWGWPTFLTLYLVVAVATWLGPIPDDPSEWVQGLVFVVPAIVIAAFGGLLLVRAPDNPMWWIFFGTSLGMVLSATNPVPEEPPVSLSLVDFLAILYESALSSLLIFYLIALMFYLFPDGRFLSRRWAWAGWFGRLAFPLMLFLYLFDEGIGPAFAEPYWTVANPIGFIPTEVVGQITFWVFGGLYLVLFGSIVALVVRYRRSTATVKAQIRWLILPCLLFILGFVSIVFGGDGLLAGLLFASPYIAIPAAITVAITRYRLFDIDRIISRTLAYALVVGILVALFAAVAIWLPSLLLGDSPPIFVAGATLAVAASFNPVRRRMQRIVDRRFNRSAYEARLLAEEFGTTVRGSLSIDELGELWSTTVEDALQPNTLGLWVRETGSR